MPKDEQAIDKEHARLIGGCYAPNGKTVPFHELLDTLKAKMADGTVEVIDHGHGLTELRFK